MQGECCPGSHDRRFVSSTLTLSFSRLESKGGQKSSKQQGTATWYGRAGRFFPLCPSMPSPSFWLRSSASYVLFEFRYNPLTHYVHTCTGLQRIDPRKCCAIVHSCYLTRCPMYTVPLDHSSKGICTGRLTRCQPLRSDHLWYSPRGWAVLGSWTRGQREALCTGHVRDKHGSRISTATQLKQMALRGIHRRSVHPQE